MKSALFTLVVADFHSAFLRYLTSGGSPEEAQQQCPELTQEVFGKWLDFFSMPISGDELTHTYREIAGDGTMQLHQLAGEMKHRMRSRVQAKDPPQEMVTHVMMLTGATAEDARQALRGTDNNVQYAVNRLFSRAESRAESRPDPRAAQQRRENQLLQQLRSMFGRQFTNAEMRRAVTGAASFDAAMENLYAARQARPLDRSLSRSSAPRGGLETQAQRRAREAGRSHGAYVAHGTSGAHGLEAMIGPHAETFSYLFLAAVLELDGEDITRDELGWDLSSISDQAQADWTAFKRVIADYAGMNGDPAQLAAQPNVPEGQALETVMAATAAEPTIPFDGTWHVDTMWQNRVMGGGNADAHGAAKTLATNLHNAIKAASERSRL